MVIGADAVGWFPPGSNPLGCSAALSSMGEVLSGGQR